MERIKTKINDNKVMGKGLSSESKLMVSVESVMRSPPVTVSFSDTVSTIVDKMVTRNIGAIIVESGGKPVGIITERDILERVIRANKDPNKTKATDIMSSPIITIESDKTLTDALKIMREKRIRRLVVTRGGNLTGIITERRILDSLV